MMGKNFEWLFTIFEHQSTSNKGWYDAFVCVGPLVCRATTIIVSLFSGDNHLCVTEVYDAFVCVEPPL
jgi:hypothetical protein